MSQPQPERRPTGGPLLWGVDTTPDLSTKQVHDAYDRIHAGDRMNAVPGYYDWLLSLLGAPFRGRMLDIGCGTGAMLAAADARGIATAGVDISDVAVARTQERVPAAELHVGVAEHLPFADGAFDIVSCLGSLEHFRDPSQAVREMLRVTRPDGRLLIGVPNSRYTLMPVIAVRMWLFPGLSQPVERYATRSEWQALFERCGLHVTAVHKDNNCYLPTRVLQTLNRALGRLTPLEHCYQFIFAARHGQVRE